MISQEKRLIITFRCTTDAIAMEKSCKAQHHKLKKKWKGICSQVSFIVLKYGQGCI